MTSLSGDLAATEVTFEVVIDVFMHLFTQLFRNFESLVNVFVFHENAFSCVNMGKRKGFSSDQLAFLIDKLALENTVSLSCEASFDLKNWLWYLNIC